MDVWIPLFTLRDKRKAPLLCSPRTICTAAYTLVELLTVIGIIALLAAILLPVLVQAKAAARQTTCTSNLRQIGLAVRMYEQDYNDLPMTEKQLSAFVNNPAIMHCPSDPTEGYVSFQQTVHDPFVPFPPSQWPKVRYSYYYVKDFLGSICLENALSSPQGGILACVLHGRPLTQFRTDLPYYEGTVLRLRNDGGVSIVQHKLDRRDLEYGYEEVGVGVSRLFSDDPPAPCQQ